MINQHGYQGKQFERTTTDSFLKMIKAMERLIELIIHIKIPHKREDAK